MVRHRFAGASWHPTDPRQQRRLTRPSNGSVTMVKGRRRTAKIAPFKAQPSACERAMDHVGYASSALCCDLFLERRRDRLVELREEVAVTVERYVDRAVAHTRLDCLRVCSCRDRERDARVDRKRVA